MDNRLFSDSNPLIALARRRQRATPLLAVFFLVPLAVIATLEERLFLTYGLLLSGFPDPAREPTLTAVALVVELMVGSATILLFLWLWLRFYEGRPLWSLGLRRTGAPRQLLWGALSGVTLISATAVLMAVLGFVALEHKDPAPTGIAAIGGVLFVALGWAAQGSMEELLCRGWALQTAAARYGSLVGILFSSLVFSLFHYYAADVGLLALANLFLLGVLLALYALLEGSLWGVCALHAAYNWTETSVLGFDFYGDEAPGGVLLNLRETGPDLITGGSVGITATGGLAQTATILLGIIILLVIMNRRSHLKMGQAGLRSRAR
jgi:membrane protease YdiL (CAAX protease family)